MSSRICSFEPVGCEPLNDEDYAVCFTKIVDYSEQQEPIDMHSFDLSDGYERANVTVKVRPDSSRNLVISK